MRGTHQPQKIADVGSLQITSTSAEFETGAAKVINAKGVERMPKAKEGRMMMKGNRLGLQGEMSCEW